MSNSDFTDVNKYEVYPNYDDGFKANGSLTTITELIAAREARQPDRLTIASFGPASKKAKPGIKFLFAMVLRITIPIAKNSDSLMGMFKKNRFEKKTNSRATYKKCILLADLADPNQLTGVILEESNEDHNRLFQRDLSLENVMVGERCVILAPRIEGNQLRNGAWVITTNRPLEFVESPKIPLRPLRSERVGHEIRYYTAKGSKVYLLEDDVVDPLRTKCNFHSCDRQNAKVLGNQTNCGCWMQNRRSDTGPRNTVLMFSFYMQGENEKVVKVTDYSSLRTSRVFFKNEQILADIETLQKNKVYNYIQEKWRKTIDHINDNGGWTIVGWYIRAELDDDEKDEADETLLRTNVKINVSYLYPTQLKSSTVPPEMTIDQDHINKIVAGEVVAGPTEKLDESQLNI